MRVACFGAVLAVVAGILSAGCEHPRPAAPAPHKSALASLDDATRAAYLRRAQVWKRIDTPALDLMAGPQDHGAFTFEEEVSCDFVELERRGHSPKFDCALDRKDVVKVEYGEENGEAFGEVAASRLLWALGFGADHWYPVRVTCRGCSSDPYNQHGPVTGESTIGLAALERRMSGHTIRSIRVNGWSWEELDTVDEAAGGAPHAQRDALKLLAVFLQHTDSKADNQRIVCLPSGHAKDDTGTETCSEPFLYMYDVGLTFGSPQLLRNRNWSSGADLARWRDQGIWKDKRSCVGNLPHTFGSTIQHPHISEAGRQFLADLLLQLSDSQIHDIFAAARMDRRVIHGKRQEPIDAWIAVFKKKRDEIVSQRCPE
jgi:hypothetical protein